MCTADSGPLLQLQDALSALTRVDPRDVSDESVRSALPALLTAFHQLAAVVSGVWVPSMPGICRSWTRAGRRRRGWSRSDG